MFFNLFRTSSLYWRWMYNTYSSFCDKIKIYPIFLEKIISGEKGSKQVPPKFYNCTAYEDFLRILLHPVLLAE